MASCIKRCQGNCRTSGSFNLQLQVDNCKCLVNRNLQVLFDLGLRYQFMDRRLFPNDRPSPNSKPIGHYLLAPAAESALRCRPCQSLILTLSSQQADDTARVLSFGLGALRHASKCNVMVSSRRVRDHCTAPVQLPSSGPPSPSRNRARLSKGADDHGVSGAALDRIPRTMLYLPTDCVQRDGGLSRPMYNYACQPSMSRPFHGRQSQWRVPAKTQARVSDLLCSWTKPLRLVQNHFNRHLPPPA